jgi:hypothetical protein
MIWLKWLPWRFALRYLARSHGFLDPVALLARVHRFAQPSEVEEPIELLRAGVLFHARGLINSRVIQHNLDWVWPYWVERQFDPGDPAFIPRAFSLTHVNLTHRNWTAIGMPDCAQLPIVDPRGLLTPHWDGWSLDGWIVDEQGNCLLPSRVSSSSQRQEDANGLSLVTTSKADGMALECRAWVEWRQVKGNQPVCLLQLSASSQRPAYLVLALRPQNPEGVSFIHEIRLHKSHRRWLVDEQTIEFDRAPDRHYLSDYHGGDVHIHLLDRNQQEEIRCDVGMASAAALFRIPANSDCRLKARIPLQRPDTKPLRQSWQQARQHLCRLACPEPHMEFLYRAAQTSLLLHSSEEIYPGPYTYKRFWFRDAAFILHAMLACGMHQRVTKALESFPARQTGKGYFLSQEGEWDANGEALWIMQRYCQLTNIPTPQPWRKAIIKGADWLLRKRLADHPDSPHAGLLPAGFSAEHLGPNDYYYWDDAWAIAGLTAAATMLEDWRPEQARRYRQGAEDFSAALQRSIQYCHQALGRPAIPASPYRRLDAGAIGSLVLSYPLQLVAADDEALLATADHLLTHCCRDKVFFQDMIHSGLNAYLTLHLAQVLLRSGDAGYLQLMDAVAALASPTGQWPEAIHPHTKGGCMGDGHHVWASAEWLMMLHHCFAREEGNKLILCAGIPQRWLQPVASGSAAPVSLGPFFTQFGRLSLQIIPDGEATEIRWQGHWYQRPPHLEVALPGFAPVQVTDGQTSLRLSRQKS